MIGTLKFTASTLGLDTSRVYQSLSANSLRAAIDEQGLQDLYAKLAIIVPDLRQQFTGSFDDNEFERFWSIKMRAQHTFQVDCALQAISSLEKNALTVVDIGDSSGNDGRYLKSITPEGQMSRFIGVNIDPVAVKKITANGGEAVLASAEKFEFGDVTPDLILCFETLEHLSDPLRFLHMLSDKAASAAVLLTVPCRRQSRFGGELIRQPESSLPDKLTPESVHLFELSPGDWILLARLAGFEVTFKRTYRQYPLRGVYRLMAPIWRRLDFEGFLALFLTPNPSLSQRYTGW